MAQRHVDPAALDDSNAKTDLNEDFIFRPWRRCPKTGAILWAKTYGLKAWKIPV